MSTDAKPVCAAEVVLRVLRGRWAPTLMMVLAEHGPIHFSAIGRQIPGISTKVLTDQLRYLVRAGVVQRSGAEKRQEIYYELTSKGRELQVALDGWNEFVRRWPDL
jgi:DNA-binding HxlR family transcriptional regulator